MGFSKITPQVKFWQEEGGREYTDRNAQSVDEMNRCYIKEYNIPRIAMNEEFMADLDRSLTILEIGANKGLQLELLRIMGFKNLLGIEVNEYAIARAKTIHPNIEIIPGSGFELPFRDGAFDLVFTSGVLIHIAPDDLPRMMKEIFRVSRRYIWGFEYFAPTPTKVVYRGNNELLWKTDLAQLYCEQFPDLQVVKEKKYHLTDSENISQMFLLEK